MFGAGVSVSPGSDRPVSVPRQLTVGIGGGLDPGLQCGVPVGARFIL